LPFFLLCIFNPKRCIKALHFGSWSLPGNQTHDLGIANAMLHYLS